MARRRRTKSKKRTQTQRDYKKPITRKKHYRLRENEPDFKKTYRPRLEDYEDRRREQRPFPKTTQGKKARIGLAYWTVRQTPYYRLQHRLRFLDPKKTVVCIRRGVRRRVMFAFKKIQPGSGAIRSKRNRIRRLRGLPEKRYNENSKVRC